MAFSPEYAVVGGALGLAMGSFLNVVIHRLPQGETPWRPSRSYCPSCRTPIRAADNVPLLSYLLLGGRCHSCKARISFRYPLVEAATGGLFAYALGTGGISLHALETILFGAFLLTLGVIDLEIYRLPDALVALGAMAAFAVGTAEALSGGTWDTWIGRAIAGLVGVGLLGAVRAVGTRIARREAMGLGDVKFLGMVGLFLGDWRLVLLTVVLSALMGSLVGAGVILVRWEKPSRAIPYGPFLALGGWVAFIAGEALIKAYLRLVLGG